MCSSGPTGSHRRVKVPSVHLILLPRPTWTRKMITLNLSNQPWKTLRQARKNLAFPWILQMRRLDEKNIEEIDIGPANAFFKGHIMTPTLFLLSFPSWVFCPEEVPLVSRREQLGTDDIALEKAALDEENEDYMPDTDTPGPADRLEGPLPSKSQSAKCKAVAKPKAKSNCKTKAKAKAPAPRRRREKLRRSWR